VTALAVRPILWLAPPTVTIRCRVCADEILSHGTSAWNDTPEGWSIDQLSFYNPNGHHYCPAHVREVWLAYCMLNSDGEVSCWSCYGESETNGVLVTAPMEWTAESVLGALSEKKAECDGRNLVQGVEKIEKAYRADSLSRASVHL